MLVEHDLGTQQKADANVAGVCNEQGNVVGLMPHPERAAAEELGSTDGLGFLTSLKEYL